MSKPDGWIFPLPINKLVDVDDVIDIPGYPPQRITKIKEDCMYTVDANQQGDNPNG